MEIEVKADLGRIKGGMRARAPRLGLSGHGPDPEAAIESLRSAIRAWLVGLSVANALEETLDRRGIPWTARTNGLEVNVTQSVATA